MWNARRATFGEMLYGLDPGSQRRQCVRHGTRTGAGLSLCGRRWSRDVAVAPSSHFAYVANCLDNSISPYRIDAQTGGLSPIAGSPFPAASCPSSIKVDVAGAFLLVLDAVSTISTYRVNPLTGSLEPRSAVAAAGGGASSLVLTSQPH